MNQKEEQVYERYIGVDGHKDYVVIGGINAQLEQALQQRRMSLERFARWAPKNLRNTDAVAIEASTNTWTLYDLMTPWAGKVVVVHPPKVKLITCARLKTDKRSVYDLARLLLVGWLPEVWVPPDHVRDLRALVSHRWRLVRTRAAAMNRLHSVLQRNALKAPRGSIFTDKHRDWWEQLGVSPTERLRIRQDLETVDHLTVQIEEVEAEIKRLSTSQPWADQIPYLMQLPGFGLKVTMTVLAAIGDITRFPTDKKLVGCSGLGAGVHDSGKTHRGKRITKEGRKELRWALVEAAHHAVRTHPYWKAEFERLAKHIGKHKAYVAIARKLLVAVWHVLTKREVARFTDEHQVARKIMTWSWKLTEEHRHGMDTPQFVRYQLLRLGIGDEIVHVQSGSRKRRIASVEEVLALHPELQPLAWRLNRRVRNSITTHSL